MKLATLTSEGWPYINPVWHHYDGEVFLVAGRRKALWIANIQNNKRVTACIDTCEALHPRVLVEAAILSNKDSVLVFEKPESHAFPYYVKYLAEIIALD